MKQMAKHVSLSATLLFQSGLFDELTATMLLLLTSNVLVSGAEVRSAEASARTACYTAGGMISSCRS